jgi:hypothetical protein
MREPVFRLTLTASEVKALHAEMWSYASASDWGEAHKDEMDSVYDKVKDAYERVHRGRRNGAAMYPDSDE